MKGGAGVGLARKGKGAKWMLVVDGRDLPFLLHLASAQQAKVRLAAWPGALTTDEPEESCQLRREHHVLW